MRIIRAIVHGLIVVLLSIVTFVGILVITLGLNLTNREVVKSWPVESGLYNEVPDRLMSFVKFENGQTLEQSIDAGLLDAQRIKTVLSEVFPAAYWAGKVNSVIDPTYDWLEGKAERLEFSVTLADKSKELATTLEKEVKLQLADAPICRINQSVEDFDLLSATCLPKGVSPAAAAKELNRELLGKDSPLDKAKFSAQDIDGLDDEAQQQRPEDFARLKSLMWMIPVIMAVLVLLAGITGKNPLYGFRKVGQTLFSVGLATWLGFYLTQYFSNRFTQVKSEDPSSQVLFNEVVNPFLKSVASSITTTGLWVSLAVIIAGVLMWLATFIWHKVHHGPEGKDAKRQLTDQETTLPKPVTPLSSKSSSKN